MRFRIRPRDLRRFVGATTLACLMTSVVASLLLFGVEVGFAYSLQAFLLLLQIATPGTLHLPAWAAQRGGTAVVLAIFLLSLLRSALMWTQTYMRDAAGEHFSSLQRGRILRWAFYAPDANAARVTSLFGERALQAGHCVRQMLTGLSLGTICLLLVASLFYLQPYVTLGVVAIVLGLMAPVRQMNMRIRRSGQGVVAEWESAYRRLVLSVKNLLLLRIYGLEEAEARQTDASLRSYLKHYLAFHTVTGMVVVIPQTVGVTLICLLLLLARTHIHLSATLLLVYFYLLVRLLQTSTPVGQAVANVVFNWPQVAVLYAWWRTEYLPSSVASALPAVFRAPSPSPSGPVGWSCEQIGFSYPGASEPVLHGLSFDIAPGSAIVVIGPSGAGKSTLLNLLLAQLTPLEGRIDLLIDGGRAPLGECKPRLMPMVGYVGAESFLIDGTIRDNLLYGLRATAADADLADALRKAECGFIDDLPNGIEHRLTNQGVGLSSGQKQRLSLARALLRRPGVLVLDEATANLDVATEEKLVDTLTQLKGGMTIVAVTHRQALLRLADQVLTLADDGRARTSPANVAAAAK